MVSIKPLTALALAVPHRQEGVDESAWRRWLRPEAKKEGGNKVESGRWARGPRTRGKKTAG